MVWAVYGKVPQLSLIVNRFCCYLGLTVQILKTVKLKMSVAEREGNAFIISSDKNVTNNNIL